MKRKKERNFNGVIITSENYRTILDEKGREGINFHNKHLKSYLQGKTYFGFGYQKDTEGNLIYDRFGNKIQIIHTV